MKLTPHRSTWNFSRGDAACNSRQHCSSAATHGPASRPSTLSNIFPRFFSVVILSIDFALLDACRCIAITIRCKFLLIHKYKYNKDLHALDVIWSHDKMIIYGHCIKYGP